MTLKLHKTKNSSTNLNKPSRKPLLKKLPCIKSLQGYSKKRDAQRLTRDINMAPSSKGIQYLGQLDAARCLGKWEDVEELARKVEKHVSDRKCLVATARSEVKVASQRIRRPGTVVLRPGTAATRPATAKEPQASIDTDDSKKALLPIIRELEAAIEFEKTYPEDRYQAQTCLAWLYWNNSEYKNAKRVAPHESPTPNIGKQINDWTTVCVVKSAFFRASSEEGLGNIPEVPKIYEACIESLESLQTPYLGVAEFCFWWERFFSRCCGCLYGTFQEQIKAGRRYVDTKAVLQAFRAWSSTWEYLSQTLTKDTESAKQKRSQRLLVWRSYYNVLTEILEKGYRYSSPLKAGSFENGNGHTAVHNRKLLFIELSKVETQYEGMLIRQVSFPEANKTNVEVDEFVNSIMATWAITCGPDWQEDDLGGGGRAAASRKVLESLYRAATLTFHSTSVLRHLFTVHSSLAEFLLAEKALDSYIDIVIKGKARVKKSGIEEAELDSDEIMLQTIASGIEMLCEFGRRTQVEKSVALSARLLAWLEENGEQLDNFPDGGSSSEVSSRVRLTAQVIASVHRAVAISRASWARLSYESKDRAKLQADAIRHLKEALRIDSTAENDPTFLYPLALVLAESRNIENAVAVLKQALAAESRTFTEPIDQHLIARDLKSRTTRNAPMVECWHLLSLLLSSRQDFERAATASATALQQYENGISSSVSSSDLRKLSFFQKKHIIEAKITQIAIAEVSEGLQEAVNTSADLISLYTLFFELPKPPQTANPASEKPPPTATGTIKSFRGSIFGRSRKSLRSSMVSLPKVDGAQDEPLPPTIAVTLDGANSSRPLSQAAASPTEQAQLPSRSTSHKLQKRHSSRHSVRRSRTRSPGRSGQQISEAVTSVAAVDRVNQRRPPSAWSNDPGEIGLAVSHNGRKDESTVRTAQAVSLRQGQAQRLDSPISKHITPPKSPEVADFSLQPPVSHKPPFYMPPPIFSPTEEHKYSIALLNHIWLFIASLYRRGNMLEDARQAMDEAFKQAKLAEATIAKPGPSSVKAFDEPGWGGVQSVEEIWADTYAEEGRLCVAEGDPYEAMNKFEGALSHFPDHAGATVELATILLDIHAKKIPLARKKPSLARDLPTEPSDDSTLPVFTKTTPRISMKPQTNGVDSAIVDEDDEDEQDGQKHERNNSSEELDLLASRDRAYTLLSNLTKLGSGWDNSEGWFALATAYEASGQIDKAKEILWWVVELEEKKSVRHWRVLGQGYKLQL